jgi:hypothetical protein
MADYRNSWEEGLRRSSTGHPIKNISWMVAEGFETLCRFNMRSQIENVTPRLLILGTEGPRHLSF